MNDEYVTTELQLAWDVVLSLWREQEGFEFIDREEFVRKATELIGLEKSIGPDVVTVLADARALFGADATSEDIANQYHHAASGRWPCGEIEDTFAIFDWFKVTRRGHIGYVPQGHLSEAEQLEAQRNYDSLE